jgi:hypothetical protein
MAIIIICVIFNINLELSLVDQGALVGHVNPAICNQCVSLDDHPPIVHRSVCRTKLWLSQ